MFPPSAAQPRKHLHTVGARIARGGGLRPHSNPAQKQKCAKVNSDSRALPLPCLHPVREVGLGPWVMQCACCFRPRKAFAIPVTQSILRSTETHALGPCPRSLESLRGESQKQMARF